LGNRYEFQLKQGHTLIHQDKYYYISVDDKIGLFGKNVLDIGNIEEILSIEYSRIEYVQNIKGLSSQMIIKKENQYGLFNPIFRFHILETNIMVLNIC
jgi:hypothetical protein